MKLPPVELSNELSQNSRYEPSNMGMWRTNITFSRVVLDFINRHNTWFVSPNFGCWVEIPTLLNIYIYI
jgi:hypothetical protein